MGGVPSRIAAVRATDRTMVLAFGVHGCGRQCSGPRGCGYALTVGTAIGGWPWGCLEKPLPGLRSADARGRHTRVLFRLSDVPASALAPD